ncbi:MAG: Flp family type IVb pilin [Asticcacaulis sp.]
MLSRSGLSRFLADESGTTAIEYGLIVGMIFLVIVTAITFYADRTNAMYQKISDAITGAG